MYKGIPIGATELVAADPVTGGLQSPRGVTFPPPVG